MSIKEILTFPHPVLITKAKPVVDVDRNMWGLIDSMAETMYSAPGLGLAAPQIGQSLQIIVVDVEWRWNEGKFNLIPLVNPRITYKEGERIEEEGCLSVPGITAPVKRAERIKVEGLDRDGKKAVIKAEGTLATALQHEIDHLDGILFIDRLSRVKRELYRKRLIKQAKEKG